VERVSPDAPELLAPLICCGPTPMLNAFEVAPRTGLGSRFHIIIFTTRSDRHAVRLTVRAGALETEFFNSGPDLPRSPVSMKAGRRLFRELGICGAREQRVISSSPITATPI